MPLFDAIESDVTAFFVSQGSVFDILIKSVLERVSTVETRVQVLRTDVTNNLQSIRQQLLSNATASIDYVGSSSPAEPSLNAEALAEAAARASETAVHASEAAIQSAIASLDEKRRTDERIAHERMLRLSQQLNAVLELIFCPHAAESAVLEIQERQKRFSTIVALLDENDRILKELQDAAVTSPGRSEATADLMVNASYPIEAAIQPAESLLPYSKSDDTPELTSISAEVQEPNDSTVPANETNVKGDRTEANEARSSTEITSSLQSIDEHHDNGEPSGSAQATKLVNGSDHQDTVSVAELHPTRRKGTNAKRQRNSNGAVDPSRKISMYHAYQDMHAAEEERLRELQQRDEELLERMREMLRDQTIATIPSGNENTIEHEQQQRQLEHLLALAADNDRIKLEQGKLINDLKSIYDRQQLMLDNALALQKDELDAIRLRIEQDLEALRRYLDDQFQARDEKAESEGSSSLSAVEQQLNDASTQLVAMLESQAQEFSTKMADFRDWALKEFVRQVELVDLETHWQRTAASNCVFGSTPAMLIKLQRELQAIQEQRSSEEPQHTIDDDDALDNGIAKLIEAVDHALKVTVDTSFDENDAAASPQYFLITSNALHALKAIRAQMSKINDLLIHSDTTDERVLRLQAIVTALRRMELGTASLLDGCDAQFTRYHEALRSHQVAIGQLQQQMQLHKQDETALKARLALCPSQEDTNRLLLDLQDKMTEMSIDSAARTAATLAELRAKMADLPDNELLERLSMDLHTKADRSDIDRLRRMLEAQAIGHSESLAPTPSLAKSPLRCLSCDQSVYTPVASQPGSPGSPHRQKCIDCGGRFASLRSYELVDSSYAPQMPLKPTNRTDQDHEADPADDLFAIAAAARHRRQHEQKQISERLSMTASGPGLRASTAGVRRGFVNLDDGRNRIPLRRTVLADHIVYGPSIAQNSVRRKIEDGNEARGMRVESPVDRRVPGGQVIARATTTSVLVRPFAELERGEDLAVRTANRQQARDRSARGPR